MFIRRYQKLAVFILIDKLTNQTVAAGMIKGISTPSKQKTYSAAERELNAYIRRHYPEWGCIEI